MLGWGLVVLEGEGRVYDGVRILFSLFLGGFLGAFVLDIGHVGIAFGLGVLHRV